MTQTRSTKHGPAVDDAMVDPRREDAAGYRNQAAAQNPEPGHAPVELRSEIARFLGPAAFPGDAATIRSVAADNDAPSEIMGMLRALPEGTYATVQEVVDALPFVQT